MGSANVLAGSSRLKHALKVLQDRWLITEEFWDDSVKNRFEERYLRPLNPAADAATIGMHKLAEVLEKLRRDCTDRSEML